MREIDRAVLDLKAIGDRLIELLGGRADEFQAALLALLGELDGDDSRAAASDIVQLVRRYTQTPEGEPDDRITDLLASTATLGPALAAREAPLAEVFDPAGPTFSVDDAADPLSSDFLDIAPVGVPPFDADALTAVQDVLTSADVVRPPNAKHVLVPIWYATDRDHRPGEGPSDRFGSERSTAENGTFLRYGTVTVSIPDVHEAGEKERPKWYKPWQKEDPDLHIVVRSIRELDHDAWMRSLRYGLQSGKPAGTDTRGDVLVFVHGYNTTWGDAARTAAQFTWDLGFQGRTVMYSWPSRGTFLGYGRDEDQVLWAQDHFTGLLQDVLANSGARRVHLVAHSMGNRLTTNALRSIAEENTVYRTPVREIVFAAPDVDRDTFGEFARRFNDLVASFEPPRAPHLTLYTCGVDSALDFSRLLHGNFFRAGDARDGILVALPMDTIEVTRIVVEETRDDWTGHAYFCTNPRVIDDLNRLVLQGATPTERHHEHSESYWRMRSANDLG